MSRKVYSKVLNTREQVRTGVSQKKVIPGRENDMVKNSEGGFTFALDKWGRAQRFLILGSEGGSYYASEHKLTLDNAKSLVECAKEDGIRLVDLIVEISDSGRAPKNDPALLALAVVMTHGNNEARNYAASAFPKVARIGTHVFHLADYINGMRSWNRPVRRGFAEIYNGWDAYRLAVQLVKYASRDGWSHRDVLRLAHIRPSTSDHDALFARVLDKGDKEIEDQRIVEFLSAVEQIKTTRDPKTAAKLITDHNLPREVVPTELWNEKVVWEALLPHMGLEAMIRNLATMTRVGLIAPNSNGTRLVLEKMSNEEAIRKSRLHPIKVLAALLTYKQGHGVRGGHVWNPVQNVLEGLDGMFYATFDNVVPTNKRMLFAMDISASMGGGMVGGVIGLTPRIAQAALVSVMMRTEKMYEVVGFTSSDGWGWGRARDYNDVSGLTQMPINKSMNLTQIMNTVDRYRMGGTDCSLPMEWARVNKVPVDAFVITTDNETYAGARHPSQALKAYRDTMGIPAKLIVVGMVANNFTIADPNDAGMMDVVGFDTAAPALINDFIRGDV